MTHVRLKLAMLILLAFQLFGGGPSAAAQAEETSHTQDNSLVTLRSTSRLVTVDVVATDKSGRFVPGLSRDSFSVLDGDAAQSINSFEEVHAVPSSPVARPAGAPVADLQTATFTNMEQGKSPLNVIVLDSLNTPLGDQVRGRLEMLSFLRQIPDGQQVAVFAFRTRLTVIQGFTSDRKAMIAALDRITAQRSLLYKTDAERMQEIASISEGAPPKLVAQLISFMYAQNAAATELRATSTLDAFRELAAALAGYPGRKNVFWLSAGFPAQLEPGFARRHNVPADYDHPLKETGALLAMAQIAIYPIDVRGLIAFGLTSEVSGRKANGRQITGQEYGALVRAQSARQADLQSTMNRIAEDTGGRAFYNTNDVAGALKTGMEHGSSYYRITYVPTHKNWDGSFRPIHVKVLGKNVTLSYRPGYYAVAQPPLKTTSKAEIADWLRPDSPEATTLPVQVQVHRLSPSVVEVAYIVPPDYFRTGEDDSFRKHVSFECVAAAWHQSGQQAGSVAHTANLILKPAGRKTMTEKGFRATEQVTIEPEATLLKVGIVDVLTGRLGTVSIDLARLPNSTGAK